MKVLLAIPLVLLLAAPTATGATPRSGLRGTALIDPAFPVCKPGASCTRPAAHARLRFWRNGRVVAQTITDGKGRYRIALRPRTYTVTSGSHTVVKPARISVLRNSYRIVTFRLDTGIR